MLTIIAFRLQRRTKGKRLQSKERKRRQKSEKDRGRKEKQILIEKKNDRGREPDKARDCLAKNGSADNEENSMKYMILNSL